MSLKDEIDTIDPQAEVQNAFDGANGSNGRRPWTIARHSVALSMKCEVMKAIGPDVEEFSQKGTYSNVLRDVVIALWLCSLPDDDVAALNVRLDLDSSTTAAFKWAEQEGITYCSHKFFEGVKLIGEIIAAALASYYAIEGGKPDAPTIKKNIARPGKSDSRTTRRSGRATRPSIA